MKSGEPIQRKRAENSTENEGITKGMFYRCCGMSDTLLKMAAWRTENPLGRQ